MPAKAIGSSEDRSSRDPSSEDPLSQDQRQALVDLIEQAHTVAPPRLLSVVRRAAAEMGAQVELLLVDFAQRQLVALGEDAAAPSLRWRVPIESSLAGRVFIQSTPMSSPP